MKEKGTSILIIQYIDCWRPDDTRGHGINKYEIAAPG